MQFFTGLPRSPDMFQCETSSVNSDASSRSIIPSSLPSKEGESSSVFGTNLVQIAPSVYYSMFNKFITLKKGRLEIELQQLLRV